MAGTLDAAAFLQQTDQATHGHRLVHADDGRSCGQPTRVLPYGGEAALVRRRDEEQPGGRWLSM